MANPNWKSDEIVSESPEQTARIGCAWAETWQTPPCVILSGPLGAGKTAFVCGIARGLGCHDPVASPSFALVHEYRGGRMPLLHFDFYRIKHEREIHALGFEEYLESGAVVVEWGERFPAVFVPPVCRIAIEPTGPHSRRLTFCDRPAAPIA